MCPLCGNKIRNKVKEEDTVLINYPLCGPKCRQKIVIEAKKLKIAIITETDAKTQSR
ncbi:cysteine-rich KTR domain-containing protein [Lachnospiraceae bacterium 45-W7]